MKFSHIKNKQRAIKSKLKDKKQRHWFWDIFDIYLILHKIQTWTYLKKFNLSYFNFTLLILLKAKKLKYILNFVVGVKGLKPLPSFVPMNGLIYPVAFIWSPSEKHPKILTKKYLDIPKKMLKLNKHKKVCSEQSLFNFELLVKQEVYK